MWIALDYFLEALHVLVISFNLTGWIWGKTRKWHLICLLLTLGSWVLLGAIYGWGYCFLTDWNWEVKNQLGETGLPGSYIKYFFDRLFQTDFDSTLVDFITLISLVVVFVLSLWQNFKGRIKTWVK